VEFLQLVKKYVELHVHPYHGLTADPSTVTTNVLSFDLNKLLNKNINTN
jgi:RecJ-like exonuclease